MTPPVEPYISHWRLLYSSPRDIQPAKLISAETPSFFTTKPFGIRNINTDKFYKFMGGQSLHDGSAVDLKNPATILKWALMISLPIPFNFALHLGTLNFHLNPKTSLIVSDSEKYGYHHNSNVSAHNNIRQVQHTYLTNDTRTKEIISQKLHYVIMKIYTSDCVWLLLCSLVIATLIFSQ